MPNKVTYSDGTTPDICIIGAGFAGLLAGIQLKRQLALTSFTIFDENEEVGGTWLTNTYPGCACDVPSYLFSYSFEPYPYWKQNYAPQEEMLMYLKNTAKKYNLYEQIELKCQVTEVKWDETISKWRVNVHNILKGNCEERQFDIMIIGAGVLHLPSIPPEFKSFEGPIVHTASWDPTVAMESKVIGVVGSGSSALQVIPALAPKVKELHSYQRQAAWVMPRPQFNVPAWAQFVFAHVPLVLLLFRWLIFLAFELTYTTFIVGSRMGRFITRVGLNHQRRQIPDDEKLRQDLTPNHTVGCKRVGMSNKYYPAMRRSNVILHREPILEVKSHSIVTSTGEQNLDVLVLATGFQTQNFYAPLKIFGKNSIDVIERWKSDAPKLYYGIMDHISPNQFFILGPNTGLGHNSYIFMMECQMTFVIKVIRELIKRDSLVVEVKRSAEEAFDTELKTGMKRTIWGQENCGSWYANSRGQVTSLWPFDGITYWRRTRVPDVNHLTFTTEKMPKNFSYRKFKPEEEIFEKC